VTLGIASYKNPERLDFVVVTVDGLAVFPALAAAARKV